MSVPTADHVPIPSTDHAPIPSTDHAPIQAKSRQLHSFYSCPNTDPTVGRFYNNKHCSNFMITEMTFFSFTNKIKYHSSVKQFYGYGLG